MAPDPEGTPIQDLRRALERLLQPEFNDLHDDVRSLLDKTRDLETRLSDPQQVSGVVQIGLADALQEEVARAPEQYSSTIAPILTTAISDQIRNARPEMINALYPIIGQTIAKAISEAFQDLRRRIDSSMQSQFNLKQQLRRFQARLRGVAEADLLLREALPYRVRAVFLIHRETGLLLKQLSTEGDAEDMDIFSAMLTAIRDFARDTFGSPEEDLEAIQYGEDQILLKNGTYAYAAAVVEGVQPAGYANAMQNVVYEINARHADALRRFSGNMGELPELHDDLLPLLNPPAPEAEADGREAGLDPGQRRALAWAALAALLALGLLAFACVFSIRLMPVAFPGPSPTPSVTATATFTPSPGPSATATPPPSLTPSPLPTASTTASPPATPSRLTGEMTGNVYVRTRPEQTAPFAADPVKINTPVEVLAVYDRWAKISWYEGLKTREGWVPLIWIGLQDPVPAYLVTPVP